MAGGVLIQSLINGLLLGGLYAVVGLGMSLVFGVMRIINLAYGDLMMIGMYLTFVLFTQWHVDPYVAVLIAFPALFVVGVVLYRLFLGRLMQRKAPEENVLLVTFGMGLLLTEIVRLLFSADMKAINTSSATATGSIAGISISVPLLVAFLIAAAVTLLLYLVLQRTVLGRSMRATSQDKEAAEMMGVDGDRIYAYVFGIGSGLAGVAGCLLLPIYYLSPTIGPLFTMKAFVVAVLGGMNSVLGSLVGGLVLGLSETLGATYASTASRDLIGYLVFILVLSLRPGGLIGRSKL